MGCEIEYDYEKTITFINEIKDKVNDDKIRELIMKLMEWEYYPHSFFMKKRINEIFKIFIYKINSK